MERFGAPPERTFAVGNDDDDVRFGKKAGVTTIWIDRGIRLQSAEPDYRITSLADLSRMLKHPA
jgi:FMN phosphatase YigB (HAD superfamily)